MTTIARRATDRPPAACPPDLFEMSREQLRDAMAESLGRTAAELVRLAWIVRLLEERGEDLTDLKLDLVPYLRLIAYGQLSPELVVRYGHSSGIMKVARGLPLPDQDCLARGDRVPMAILRPDGSTDQQMADPSLMTTEQIRQVFALGRIRSIEEQVLILRDRPARKPKRRPQSVGRVHVTTVGDGIIVEGRFIPKADVVGALAMMANPETREQDDEDEDDSRKALVVYLLESQHERLKQAADKGKTKMATLVRRALAAYGLI